MTEPSSYRHAISLDVVSDYELFRVIESTQDLEELSSALGEREKRLRTRAYSREFWTDVFNQETRKMRDNLGGEFVTVKRGSYIVGAWNRPHRGARRFEVADPFAIGRFPVTESAWKRFVDAGGYEDPVLWDEVGWQWKTWSSLRGPWLWTRYRYREDRARHPMAGITYFEARAYCRWRTGRESGGAVVRLPTAEEWQAAARGRYGRTFPWGWVRDSSRANVHTTRYAEREPVNRHPAGVSPSGCWDMVGNIGEITANQKPRARQLYRQIVKALQSADSHAGFRMAYDLAPVSLRMFGGSYLQGWDDAECGQSRYRAPDERVRDMGVRVVRVPALA